MFNPTMHVESEFCARTTMILMSIEKCGEQKLRKELFGNIIVTGGNTSYEGFKDRVEREITLRAANSIRSRVAVVQIHVVNFRFLDGRFDFGFHGFI